MFVFCPRIWPRCKAHVILSLEAEQKPTRKASSCLPETEKLNSLGGGQPRLIAVAGTKHEQETDGLSEANLYQVQDELASFEGTWGGV